MSSHSFIDNFPMRIVGRAAAVASPFVFVGEFISYVVKPLYPYAVYVLPALIAISAVFLGAWFALFMRPKRIAFKRGEIDSATYSNAVYNCALAQWLMFCVMSAAIFGGVVLVKHHCHKSKGAEYWRHVVTYAQKNTPVLRERIAKAGSTSGKAISTAATEVLLRTTDAVAHAKSYYEDHKSGVVYTVSATTTNILSKAKTQSEGIYSNALKRIKAGKDKNKTDEGENQELPTTPPTIPEPAEGSVR